VPPDGGTPLVCARAVSATGTEPFTLPGAARADTAIASNSTGTDNGHRGALAAVAERP